MDMKDEIIAALLASCEEFLPILEAQLASAVLIAPDPDQRAAFLESPAYQAAKARVERMRAAIAKAKA